MCSGMRKSATASPLTVPVLQSVSSLLEHSPWDVSAETLRRTTLGDRKIGEHVNLERSLRLSDRLGGHLVLGHVDEVATIRSWKDEGDASVGADNNA